MNTREKTVKVTVYICEKCGREFDEEAKCLSHEETCCIGRKLHLDMEFFQLIVIDCGENEGKGDLTMWCNECEDEIPFLVPKELVTEVDQLIKRNIRSCTLKDR